MRARTVDEQLTKYLTDVHSIEVQALAQLEAAPGIAGDPRLAEAFSEHLEETREQERLVRGALAERGADPSTVKDLTGRVGGWGMIVFARLNPDTPGKLTAHAFSYEHLEVAAYELLARAAQQAGDQGVVDLAHRIGAQEKVMAERLAANFDVAVAASLRGKDHDHIGSELVSYLRDAHALESQGLQLLEIGPRIAGFGALAQTFREHRDETREHQRMVGERLRAHNSAPSRVQDTAMRIGGFSLGAFFAAQPDTPAKLAGFAFAFEHLEIAGYELLGRIAVRADDHETSAVAGQILVEEQHAAERISGTWGAAMDAALGKVGVSEPGPPASG